MHRVGVFCRLSCSLHNAREGDRCTVLVQMEVAVNEATAKMDADDAAAARSSQAVFHGAHCVANDERRVNDYARGKAERIVEEGRHDVEGAGEVERVCSGVVVEPSQR